jgi:hypothetical protein
MAPPSIENPSQGTASSSSLIVRDICHLGELQSVNTSTRIQIIKKIKIVQAYRASYLKRYSYSGKLLLKCFNFGKTQEMDN